MDHRAITALLEALIPEIKEHSSRLVEPIKDEMAQFRARFGELEAREPARGERGEPGTPTIEQVTEAIRALHVDTIIREALTAESHKGGIDVVAPKDVAWEMTNATAMLAEPFPARTSGGDKQSAISQRPRSFRFERDADNRIVAAFEEFEG